MNVSPNPSGRRRAFSLIEIMVAVTLLSLIMIGLLAVFNHVQRALRMAHTQTDVSEGARLVVEMIQHDLSVANSGNDAFVPNVYASDVSTDTLPLPGGGRQTNIVQDLFLLSRDNDVWSAFGYYIDQKAGGVGTLYRFSTNGMWFNTASGSSSSGGGPTNAPGTNTFFSNSWKTFNYVASNTVPTHRIVDGVVHFEARAFDEKGSLYTGAWYDSVRNSTNIDGAYKYDLTNDVSIRPDQFAFSGPFLPAYLEVEIGLLEPDTTRKFNAIALNNPVAAQKFLTNQVGKIHLFRQRIPVRNHIKPEAFD